MKFYIFLLLVFALSFSCSRRTGVRDACELPCGKSLMCTYEFRSIAVEISDRSGNGIVLDSFAVVRKSDNKAIVINQQAMIPQAGRYVLFSDSYLNETSRCGEDFEFRAYKANEQIANRTFTIAHNCCHIFLVEGDTRIIVGD